LFTISKAQYLGGTPMKQPMVVGYKGEIGSFILNGLLRIMPKALDIWCVDINETQEEAKERIKKSDTIFLCVPIDNTVDWLIEHIELLKGKTIIEQCSLKEWLYENESIKELNIKSMHVLFRPSQTPNLEDRKVGLFAGQFDDVLVEDIKKITQSKIVWYKHARDHDMEMSIQQALTHRMLMVLGHMLKQCSASTYISKKVLELEERIKKGDLGLYKRIQENKYLPIVTGDFQAILKEFNIEEFWKL
jgi:prephenate dehydrogenase